MTGSRRLAVLWWRNVVGVGATLAAMAVFVGIDFWPQWSNYRSTVVPQQVVPARAAISFDGRIWQLQTVRYLAVRPGMKGPPLPAGAVLAAVTIDRSGAGGRQCDVVLTDGTRRWATVPMTLSAASEDEFTTSCSQSGALRVSFEIPGDAVPTALDITDSVGSIRLQLQM